MLANGVAYANSVDWTEASFRLRRLPIANTFFEFAAVA